MENFQGATLHDRSYFSKKCWIHAPEAQPAKFSASVIAFRSTSGDDDGPEPWSTDSTGSYVFLKSKTKADERFIAGCLLPGYYDCGIVQADFTTLVSGPGAAPMLGGGEKPYRQMFVSTSPLFCVCKSDGSFLFDTTAILK